MKSSVIIGALGVGAIGFVIYKYLVQPQQGSTTTNPYSNPNTKIINQPAAVYPLQPIVAPRVDNSNQPWYAGSRASNDTPDKNLGGVDSNFLANVQTIGAIDDVGKSLSSLWDQFSGYFNDDSTQSDIGAFNWDSISEPSNYWNA